MSFNATSVNLDFLDPVRVMFPETGLKTWAVQVTRENIGALSMVFERELDYVGEKSSFAIMVQRRDSEKYVEFCVGDWIVALRGELHKFQDHDFRMTFHMEGCEHFRESKEDAQKYDPVKPKGVKVRFQEGDKVRVTNVDLYRNRDIGRVSSVNSGFVTVVHEDGEPFAYRPSDLGLVVEEEGNLDIPYDETWGVGDKVRVNKEHDPFDGCKGTIVEISDGGCTVSIDGVIGTMVHKFSHLEKI